MGVDLAGLGVGRVGVRELRGKEGVVQGERRVTVIN